MTDNLTLTMSDTESFLVTNTDGNERSSRYVPAFRPNAHQLQRVDAVGIDELCAMVESGLTMAEIANRLDVNESTIYKWIDRTNTRERFTRAKRDSAEALLDRGMVTLERADERSGPAVNKARYIAMEWARRAAIRDPSYSEKQSVELSGSLQTTTQLVHVYVPANGRDEKVIDVETE